MLDVTKPVQTRDGRKARIICTDRQDNAENSMPIVALIETVGLELMAFRYADGRTYLDRYSDSDLINVPVKHVAWFNVYPSMKGRKPHGGQLYDTEEEAKHWALKIAGIKQIKVEWEE